MRLKLTQNQATTLFLFLIIVVFIFMSFTLYYLFTNKEAFTSNPIIYGVDKMGLGDCYCSCYTSQNIYSFSVNSSVMKQNTYLGLT